MHTNKVILHLFNGVINKISSNTDVDIVIVEEDTEGINDEPLTISDVLHTHQIIPDIDITNPLKYLDIQEGN